MTAGQPNTTEQAKVPKEVYTALPLILQDGCSIYDRTPDKEAFLHAALTVLTRALPKTRIALDDKDHALSLCMYLYGRSTGGKGVASHAMQLLSALNKRENENNKRLQQEYEQALKQDTTNAPEPPLVVDTHLPLRTTPSTLLARFNQNPPNTVHLLTDTEGHALGSPTHKDHGSLRQIILKGAEGEEDGQLWKKEGKVHVDVWLSMLISSTPQQMLDGIGSTEDGLFSRFLWYSVESKEGVYISPKRTGSKPKKQMVADLGPRVVAIYDLLNDSQGVEVTFTNKQYDEHTVQLQKLMTAGYAMHPDLGAFVGRLGKRVMRTAATFALLRRAEEGGPMPKTVVCDELSWHAAAMLAEPWFDSMVDAFSLFNPKMTNTDKDESAPQIAAQLVRGYLVKEPNLKPSTAVQKLQAEGRDGLTMWLNSVSSMNNSVRKLINQAKKELENA